jgi:hypothetical protein
MDRFPLSPDAGNPTVSSKAVKVTVGNVSGPGAPVVAHRRPHASGVEPEGASESAQPPADPDGPRVIRYEVDWGSPVTQQQVQRSFSAHLVRRGWSREPSGCSGSRGR